MPFFTPPKSFRNANAAHDLFAFDVNALTTRPRAGLLTSTFNNAAAPHSSHPPLPHLVLLVLEAVLEVVCVSLPGYIVARMGMFDAEAQKFMANLNVVLFTPCLSMSISLAKDPQRPYR